MHGCYGFELNVRIFRHWSGWSTRNCLNKSKDRKGFSTKKTWCCIGENYLLWHDDISKAWQVWQWLMDVAWVSRGWILREISELFEYLTIEMALNGLAEVEPHVMEPQLLFVFDSVEVQVFHKKKRMRSGQMDSKTSWSFGGASVVGEWIFMIAKGYLRCLKTYNKLM